MPPPGTIHDWHHMFGIALTDLFTGTPWVVELEKELALGSRQLDVAIIERAPGAAIDGSASVEPFPDGLEGLRRHNLLTFKSHHEALSPWAVNELIGHYVDYRKVVLKDANKREMLPESDFALFAVAVRFPRDLV